MDEVKKIILWITGVIMLLILVACIILVVNLITTKLPSPPVLISSTSLNEQEVKAKEIANYKELTSTLQAQRTNIFDFVILKALLPLITSMLPAVLAYILAKVGLQILNNYLAKRK